MMNTISLAETLEPPCVSRAAQMPRSWRPPPLLQKSLNSAPWSAREAKDRVYAKKKGVDEMIDYFKRKPLAVRKLWDDSIESLIDATYGSANKPELDARIIDAARHNLTALLAPYRKRDPKSAECDEFEDLLPLTLFAERLYPPEDELKKVATQRVNAAYRRCGSLEAATEDVLEKVRTDNQEPRMYIDHLEDLFDLYVWTLWLTEAELYPDIELPNETRAFSHEAWKIFETFPLPGMKEFKAGVKDERFITLADLATHISEIPSGIGRFPLYVSDKPDLYRFIRQYFYAEMRSGDRDLFALFVDTLREYGCNASNDVQVRDGTRYLLKDFHRHHDKWMNYHEKHEPLNDPIDYVKIHHAWTAVLGIRDRKPEPPNPGTYGALIRRWLPHPHRGN